MKLKIGLLVVLLFCLLSVSVVSYAAQQNNESMNTKQDQNALEKLHFKFNDSIDYSSDIKIDKTIALKNAQETFPQWANDATEIVIETHLVTNPYFFGFSDKAKEKNPKLKEKGFMDNTPAYIISYKGMSYSSNVPAGYSGAAPIHHEYNVIVDASTGEPLMGFSYR